MAINFDFAKKFAAKQVLKQIMKYVKKDPEKNFMKIMNLADKIANTENHHENIAMLKEGFKNNTVVRDYVKKFLELAPSYQEGLIMNFFINSGLLGIPQQHKVADELGVDVPWAILLDPTSACNLNCTGCWAGKYDRSNSLDIDTIDRVISEAKEMGIYFIALSGGEPTVYPDLLEIFERHQDVAFMMYTNGTLIDDEMADRMLEVGNVSPAISLEGFRESTDERRGEGVFDKVMGAMDRLRERGIPFGVSVTATRDNVDELFGTDDFVDLMIEKGALYGWAFHYIPIGENPNPDMMITPQQREELAYRIPEIRSNKSIFFMDFWNDGTAVGGCIAGGRRYFHINAKGEVEPCAFVHFAADNIKDKSLREVLQNPLFKSYQKRQPFTDNLMAPCPIIDNPQELRDMVEESGASPTHPGAETVLKGNIANKLDDLSQRWHKCSKHIHDERMNTEEDQEPRSKEGDL